jgi:recombinational DNA repair protein RecR
MLVYQILVVFLAVLLVLVTIALLVIHRENARFRAALVSRWLEKKPVCTKCKSLSEELVCPLCIKFSLDPSKYDAEIDELLDKVIPKNCVVRICEGGGPEDKMASLAVSVSKLASYCTDNLCNLLQEAQDRLKSSCQCHRTLGSCDNCDMRHELADRILASVVFKEPQEVPCKS